MIAAFKMKFTSSSGMNFLNLFEEPLQGCEMTSSFGPLGTQIFEAQDLYSSVYGFDLPYKQNNVELANSDLAPKGILWLPDVCRQLNYVLESQIVTQCWTTYHGAHWAVSPCLDGQDCYLIYEGKRKQFNKHTCGWRMPVEKATHVVIYTTMPTPMDLVPGISRDIREMPIPEGWIAPGKPRDVPPEVVKYKGYTIVKTGEAGEDKWSCEDLRDLTLKKIKECIGLWTRDEEITAYCEGQDALKTEEMGHGRRDHEHYDE